MSTWEYFVRRADADLSRVETKDGDKPLKDHLNMMGEKGWELVAVAPLIREKS